MITTYRYGNYGITPTARQIPNANGSKGKWIAHADIQRQLENEDLLEPHDWDDKFDSEEEAKNFALAGARHIIDSGRCQI